MICIIRYDEDYNSFELLNCPGVIKLRMDSYELIFKDTHEQPHKAILWAS